MSSRAAEAAATAQAIRVLHLEDSTIDAELISEYLAEVGPVAIDRVWTREAFDAALRRRAHDLILADHQLPAFDGEAALEMAQAIVPHVPFIFVSGTLGEDVAVEALKRGATDFVIKQRLHRLIDVVRRALREAAERVERQRAEAALRTSEQKFASLVDMLPQHCYMLAPDGNLLWCNRQWHDYTGLTIEQAAGWGWRAVIHPDHVTAVEKGWRASLLTAEPFDMVFPVRAVDGSYGTFLSRIVPIRGADGHIEHWIGTNTDITAQQQAEEEVRGLNESLEARVVEAVKEREALFTQLAEIQKLETIGQLTGGVAHDFNNLLTPIIGSLDLLRDRVADDARSQRLVGAALQGAERARILVHRLLSFARRQVLAPRAVELTELVQGMVDLMRRTIGMRIEVMVSAAADLPPARVDPTQLELALLNLAVNARDAMPDGGRINITLDSVSVSAEAARGLRHGRYVRIAVEDTGTGMDAETLQRAIEPFYSTKGIGKGTGLGLSMVHGLAGQSGGKLTLQSEPGKGTRAVIWLPAAPGEADDVGDRDDDEAPAMAPATVLLVDDEDIVRESTAEMLADLGHRVIPARSASEAIERVKRDPAIDVVVTDYLMPGMTGAQLAAELRRHDPKLPIILITGYANLAGDEMAMLPLLQKPFRQSELAQRLRPLLRNAAA